jgi:capsular polysaccharide biosynthesis protein
MGFFGPSNICHDNKQNSFHILTIHVRAITGHFTIYAAKSEYLNKSEIIVSNSVEQSPYCETDDHSATQKIASICGALMLNTFVTRSCQ